MRAQENTGNFCFRSRFLFLLLIIFISNVTTLISQDTDINALRQSSVTAFKNGDYEKAFSEFTDLLKLYPKDPLYKYYSGVCLIKLNQNPDKAETLLKEAISSATVARIVPADAIYWIGRAQQLSGKFNEAIDSYNTFTVNSGKKAARDLGVPDFIEQCNNRKGQINISEPAISQPVLQLPEEKISRELIKPEEENRQTVLPVSDTIKAGETLPANYDRMLSEALILQSSADSLYKVADNFTGNNTGADYKTRAELKSKKTEIENLAASYQKQADQKYAEAQAEINKKPFVPFGPFNREQFPAGDSTKNKNEVAAVNLFLKEGNNAHVEDTFKVSKSSSLQAKIKVNQNTGKAIDTIKRNIVVSKPEIKNQQGSVNSVFEVSSDEIAGAADRVKIDPEVPPGLVYRIQIAVFRNPVVQSYFKGISPVYGFKVQGTDKTNYCAGMFRRLADANKALATVRKKGFRDAFIVSLYGGKAVSSERAALLEKEWGQKPFIINIQNAPVMAADTVPPTLEFRVEVQRSAKPLKDDVVKEMRRIAGDRGFDTERMKDGTVVYLIGKFITYESAEEYADLLVNNGYHDAKVVARLGTKEIPVDTARSLFEKLE